MWSTNERRWEVHGPTSWMGGLVEHQRDQTGQVYQRNRYYEPSTGRFTQEDPIGLAGGLNLYGYAGGDPVNYSDPFGLRAEDCCKEWLKGVGSAARMTLQWARGTGAEDRTFSDGSVEVAQLKNAQGVRAARAFFHQKNAGNFQDGLDLEGITNFRGSFGLPGLARAGLNPTQQFVGSFRVDIAVNEDRSLTFTLTNTTSATSGLYRLSPSWDRSRFGPGGNMRQTYTWTEKIGEGELLKCTLKQLPLQI